MLLLNIAYYVKDDNILSKLANMYDVDSLLPPAILTHPSRSLQP